MRVPLLFALCSALLIVINPANLPAQAAGAPTTPTDAPTLDNLTLLLDHAYRQPQDFGVACMPLFNTRQTALYNGDAFPLASVSKLLVFIAYAQRVDSGRIPLGELVSVTELERYNLPRTDRGAHDRFMAQYPLGTQTLSLWDVATEGMMQYSSNAASDYLLDRLGVVNWDALYESLFIWNTTHPTPLTMIPLLMNNHEVGQADLQDVALLSLDLGTSYLSRYVNDPNWREEEIRYRQVRRRSFPEWDVQAAILQQHTTTGNVNDFRNVLQAIYGNNSPLTENVKFMVRSALRWDDNAYINANYVEYGSKLGFYSGGVLTLVAYGEPRGGTPVISVTFMRNIPRSSYYDMLRADTIGDFAHWLHMTACSGLRDLIEQIRTANA